MKRSSWIPLVAGAVAFFLTLGIGGAAGTDWLARNIEMDRLVSAIEVSEAAMGVVQDRVSVVLGELDAADLQGGPTDAPNDGQNDAQTDAQADAQIEAAVAELASIAVDGADSIGAAGRAIAAINVLPWHTEIETAREVYLLHNYAWQAYMQAAIEDPVAFTVDQPLVNQSFVDSQQPLEDAIPDLSLFDLEQRVENIFVEGAPQSSGEII